MGRMANLCERMRPVRRFMLITDWQSTSKGRIPSRPVMFQLITAVPLSFICNFFTVYATIPEFSKLSQFEKVQSLAVPTGS